MLGTYQKTSFPTNHSAVFPSVHQTTEFHQTTVVDPSQRLPPAPLPSKRVEALLHSVTELEDSVKAGGAGPSRAQLGEMMSVVHMEERGLRVGEGACLRFQNRTYRTVVSKLSSRLSTALYGKQGDSAQLAKERVLFTSLAPATVTVLGLSLVRRELLVLVLRGGTGPQVT